MYKIDIINFSIDVQDKNKIRIIVNNIFNRNSYCLKCRLVIMSHLMFYIITR